MMSSSSTRPRDRGREKKRDGDTARGGILRHRLFSKVVYYSFIRRYVTRLASRHSTIVVAPSPSSPSPPNVRRNPPDPGSIVFFAREAISLSRRASSSLVSMAPGSACAWRPSFALAVSRKRSRRKRNTFAAASRVNAVASQYASSDGYTPREVVCNTSGSASGRAAGGKTRDASSFDASFDAKRSSGHRVSQISGD